MCQHRLGCLYSLTLQSKIHNHMMESENLNYLYSSVHMDKSCISGNLFQKSMPSFVMQLDGAVLKPFFWLKKCLHIQSWSIHYFAAFVNYFDLGLCLMRCSLVQRDYVYVWCCQWLHWCSRSGSAVIQYNWVIASKCLSDPLPTV